jgi:hypothetical protein
VNGVGSGSQKNGTEEYGEQPNRRPHPNSLVELDIHKFTEFGSRMRSATLQKYKQVRREPRQDE